MLDNADFLFEWGGDARNHLVELLDSLCSTEKHLKLLITSEHKLLRDTSKRFSGDGSEVVVRVKPLKDADAANFLNENLPRHFTKTELQIPTGVPCTPKTITYAIQNHPTLREVLTSAQGHPGTLVRGFCDGSWRTERTGSTAVVKRSHRLSRLLVFRQCCVR